MDLNLRGRYGAALLLVVLAMAGVFVAAMGLFVEVLEYKLLHDTLARELAEQRLRLERDPDWPGPSGGDISRILVDPVSVGGLAPVLANMASGEQQEIELDGRSYMVGRTDIGDRRLYLLLDIEPVENIERRLIALAAVTTTAAVLLALVLGSALGRRVLDPVSRLVQDVAQLDPQRPGAQLASTHGTAEIRPIAQAIDQYQERVQAILEREHTLATETCDELRMQLVKLRAAAELLSAQTGPTAAEAQRSAET